MRKSFIFKELEPQLTQTAFHPANSRFALIGFAKFPVSGDLAVD